MSEQSKPPLKFKNEAQERTFWESKSRDSTEYLDWAKAQRVVLPNLKLSTKTISLRLSQHLLVVGDNYLVTAARIVDTGHARLDQGGSQRARCSVSVTHQGLAAGEDRASLIGRDSCVTPCGSASERTTHPCTAPGTTSKTAWLISDGARLLVSLAVAALHARDSA